MTAAGSPESVSEHTVVARGALIDRYVVLDEIGSGGFGVVLKAYDPELGRHVALKLLHVRHLARSKGARQLLLREARAIAKLNHPNVVSIYDVGDHGDQVFIAMELIDGRSLRDWMSEGTRSWREVVPLFVQAGRGLAAAHKAGIVHRDFKPGNVLVGDDGRVRVLDFGLARAFGGEADATDDDTPAPDGILSETLSQTRGVAGTPAYMSPEQHMGDTPDARSDMFSFCVALYEALAGERPFRGQSLRELRANLLDGASEPFPDDVTVPGWLRELIAKGLATEPADRFASMDELIEQLAADRKRSFIVPAIAIAAVIGATSATLLLSGTKADEQAELCHTGGDRVTEAWNDGARQRIRSAFADTKLSFAGKVSGEVITFLDGYATRWSREWDQACHDTHVTGVQSDRMMDARMWCLRGQLNRLSAVVDTFATAPDRALLVRATEVLGRLQRPRECAERIALAGISPPPPAKRRETVRLRRAVANATTRGWAGGYKRALAQMKQLEPAITANSYPPLYAEWAIELAWLYRVSGDDERARDAYLTAAKYSAEAKVDLLLARAQVHYAELAIDYKSPEQAKRMLNLAETAVRRAGSPMALRALLLNARGKLAERQGDLVAAEKRFRAFADLVRDAESISDRVRLRAEISVATTLLKAGKYDEAIAHFERILPDVRSVLGARHPSTGRLYRQLAVLYNRRGHRAKARAANAEALAIYTQVHGPDHPETTNVIEMSANLAQDAGDYATAVRMLRRVIALRVKKLGRKHILVGAGYGNLANALDGLGKRSEALETYRTALEIIRDAAGENHPHYADTLGNYGGVLLSAGKTKQAVDAFRRSLALIEKRTGGDHVDLVYPLLGLCDALVKTGDWNQLLVHAKRGVRIAKRAHPAVLHSLRYYLGRGMYHLGRDRARARAMMIDAGNKLVAIGGAQANKGRAILSWVATLK